MIFPTRIRFAWLFHHLPNTTLLLTLVNNAGFVATQKKSQVTSEDIKQTVVVSHLGYFMLSNLVRPSLLQSKATQIMNVSSEAHHFVRFGINNL